MPFLETRAETLTKLCFLVNLKTAKENFEINRLLAPIVCFPELVSSLNWIMGSFGSTTYTAVSTLILFGQPVKNQMYQ